MKKLSLLLLTLLLMAAVVIACDNGNPEDGETTVGVTVGNTDAITDGDTTESTEEVNKSLIAYEDGTAIEDGDLHGWFDYGSVTYMRNKFTVKRRDTIDLSMAKNEIEGFQYLLASNENYDDLILTVSTLTDGQGNTLSGTVYLAYNVNVRKVEGPGQLGYCPEPILPLDDSFVGGTFDVVAGRAKTLYVQYKTDANTVPGIYEGRLEVKNGDEVILSGDVSVTVWDLYYDEKTASMNGFGCGYWPGDGLTDGPASAPAMIVDGKFDNTWMKPYCDFMLENRISVAYIPLDGGLLNENAAEYMDNPRFSFATGFTDGAYDPENLTALYQVASAHEGWSDKLVFGYYDEPHKEEHVQLILNGVRNQQPYFPTTNYMTCSHADVSSGGKNLAERYAEFSTFHCFKDQLFDTPIGDTLLRLKAERGDTVLWYTCGGSLRDMINLQAGVNSTLKRLYSWQQYLYGIDGMLYWNIARWQSLGSKDIWDADYEDYRFKPLGSIFGPTGDGVLVYWHPETKMPVAGLGMEAVRDGIEDYQLLSMAEDVLGREAVLDYVKRLTTSKTEFTHSADELQAVKNELAAALMAAVNP
jgi:hypothetical protein